MLDNLLQELIRSDLSPAILSGNIQGRKPEIVKLLRKQLGTAGVITLSGVRADDIEYLKTLLSLKDANTRCIVIDAEDISPRAWEKILKALEEYTGNVSVYILSRKTPRSIETRCFRLHVPSSDDTPLDYSGTSAFAVGSWLISVDVRDREQFFKSCTEWRPEYTDLLLTELSEQLLDNSVLGLDLEKRLTNKNLIMAAVFMLNKYKDSPVCPIYTGLKLMS